MQSLPANHKHGDLFNPQNFNNMTDVLSMHHQGISSNDIQWGAVKTRSIFSLFLTILGRELGPGGVSPNQRSRWKHAFSPLKHV